MQLSECQKELAAARKVIERVAGDGYHPEDASCLTCHEGGYGEDHADWCYMIAVEHFLFTPSSAAKLQAVLPRAKLTINNEKECYEMVSVEPICDHDGDGAGQHIADIYSTTDARTILDLWNNSSALREKG
jgi:hypothetical protein